MNISLHSGILCTILGFTVGRILCTFFHRIYLQTAAAPLRPRRIRLAERHGCEDETRYVNIEVREPRKK